MGEIQSIKIGNFSVSQCNSLSEPYVQRENPSLECLTASTLIYISHCSWEEVAGSMLHFKNRISQLSVQAKPTLTPKKTQTMFFFIPLIFIMSDPCLQILIAQTAPYVHAVSHFFYTLKPNCLYSQLQSESSGAGEVTSTLGLIPKVPGPFIITATGKKIILHLVQRDINSKASLKIYYVNILH